MHFTVKISNDPIMEQKENYVVVMSSDLQLDSNVVKEIDRTYGLRRLVSLEYPCGVIDFNTGDFKCGALLGPEVSCIFVKGRHSEDVITDNILTACNELFGQLKEARINNITIINPQDCVTPVNNSRLEEVINSSLRNTSDYVKFM